MGKIPKKLVVQKEVFDPSTELTRFLALTKTSGAVCQFIGLVRDYRKEDNEETPLHAMRLQHYPGMTEKVLNDLITEAEVRFSLETLRVVHRYGLMQPHETIVMVMVASSHRGDAFAACEFLMDRLKTDAPFWKCEYTQKGEAIWVDAKEADDHRAQRWKG